MTTRAYPPSIGGAQQHIADLRTRLQHFDADIATLWRRQRSDWLLGTTIRLGEPSVAEVERGVRALGWSRSARGRMGPWVAAYYAWPAVASQRIALRMIPFVELAVDAEHKLIHSHRIGREFLAQASLAVARSRCIPFVVTAHHHAKWRGRRYEGWTDVYRAADAVLTHTDSELRELVSLGVAEDKVHVISGAADEARPASAARFRAKTACGGLQSGDLAELELARHQRPNQVLLLLAGERFVDGKLQRQPTTEGVPRSSTHPTRLEEFPQVLTRAR